MGNKLNTLQGIKDLLPNSNTATGANVSISKQVMPNDDENNMVTTQPAIMNTEVNDAQYNDYMKDLTAPKVAQSYSKNLVSNVVGKLKSRVKEDEPEDFSNE